MCECAKDKETFTWSEPAQASFDNVKQLLVCSSALALYDPSLHSVILTDACDYELEAVFSLIQRDQPVAFASRTLTVTKIKYSIMEKEALASVCGLRKRGAHISGVNVLSYVPTTKLLRHCLLKRD